MAWANSVRETDQILSVLVLGELLRGVERMPEGERRRMLGSWAEICGHAEAFSHIILASFSLLTGISLEKTPPFGGAIV